MGGGGGGTSEIRIRLRRAGRELELYGYTHVLGTMLHELVGALLGGGGETAGGG